MPEKRHQHTGRQGLYAALVFAVLVTACASVDQGPARKEIGGAESAISQAQAGNAREYAPLELTMAQGKLARANAAFADEKYTEAEYLAEQALADARLAEAKTQNARTKEMVQALQKSIGDLRREIEHNETVQ
ncbi:MAG: DUF4398 domain-containing protein [Desulfobacteraceae bacterium]|nr:MAG: DUF4398 domain-containing protein [Desulfobacteraceae bacterium]